MDRFRCDERLKPKVEESTRLACTLFLYLHVIDYPGTKLKTTRFPQSAVNQQAISDVPPLKKCKIVRTYVQKVNFSYKY
jgi:hypothetical protein